MRAKPYYSVRVGKHPSDGRVNLPTLRKLLYALYNDFEERSYFQELTGYRCVDDGLVTGLAGKDVDAFVLRKLRKPGLWPISNSSHGLTEEDVFDLLEFLHDYVSKPSEGQYHDFGNCGWHYSSFDRVAGRKEFREEVNDLIRDYGDGFELSNDGEILSRPKEEVASILDADLPTIDPENVSKRVAAATRKFRSRHASQEERGDAIRDLADVLEFLRPRLKEVLASRDEQDLFNIVNNFGIRHHNQLQKTGYNKLIWYSWMFYFFLATIHAAVRLISQSSSPKSEG